MYIAITAAAAADNDDDNDEVYGVRAERACCNQRIAIIAASHSSNLHPTQLSSARY